MASIQSVLKLNDQMTATLKQITGALDKTLTSFERVQKASGQSFDSDEIKEARTAINQANAAVDKMIGSYEDLGQTQDVVNDKISEGAKRAGNLSSMFSKVGSMAQSGLSWLMEGFDDASTQNNGETQLNTVLKNMGAAEGAMDSLKNKASELQNSSMYGDDAFLGGAAEFATYMSDDKAISVMMDTLANYAAGMSGGGEVGYTEMVDYATGLGKIMTGSYDAMTKKGFEFTDQQKEMIENGDDMQKAMVISEVVNESWAGLAANMANTPAGKITQLKNAFGDMRENLISALYPVIMTIVNAVQQHMPQIERLINSLAKPISVIINLIMRLAPVVDFVFNIIIGVMEWISENVWVIYAALGVVLAAATYAIYQQVAALYAKAAAWAAAHWQMTLIIVAAAALIGYMKATGEAIEDIIMVLFGVVAVIAAIKIAQQLLNSEFAACPIVWILVLVIAIIAIVVVIFYKFTSQIIGTIFALGALFKNIGLWLANLGLAIWTCIKNAVTWMQNLGAAIWAIIQNIGAWFGNLGMGIYNVFSAVISNIGTAFHNLWLDVQIGFWSMVNVLMQGLKNLANLINNVLGWMGVDIDTSGLDFAADKINEINSKRESYKDIGEAWEDGFNTFTYQNVGDAFHSHDSEYGSVSDAFGTFDTFQDGWWDEAYAQGAQHGENAHAWMDEQLRKLNGLMGGAGAGENGNYDPNGASDYEAPVADDVGDMAGDVGDIAGDTGGISKSLDITNEELEYLRDIAEKEAINRFTTAEVKIDMTGMTNKIDGNMDLDGVISTLTDEFVGALQTAADGVY